MSEVEIKLSEALARLSRLRELIEDWHDNGEYNPDHPREVAIYKAATSPEVNRGGRLINSDWSS